MSSSIANRPLSRRSCSAHPKRRSSLLRFRGRRPGLKVVRSFLSAFFRRLIGFDAISTFQPSAKIDIGAAPGAKRLKARNRPLAAGRALAHAGWDRRDRSGTTGIDHAADIGSQGHDVKRLRVAIGGTGLATRQLHDRDPAPETHFQGSKRRCRRPAQRRLDSRNDSQAPIPRRVCAGFDRQPAQRLECQCCRAFARTLRLRA